MRAEIGTEFLYFTIENAYGFYGKQTIRLKDVGLVNVIGRNLETKNESSSGAGKSRFWRLFRYLFWGKEALDGVAEKKGDMSIFGENFRIEVGFIARGQTYIVRETRKHALFKDDGLALYMCPNGLNDRTRVPAGPQNDPARLRRYIQTLINLTHDEATGTVIWPQNFGHTLIKGTPSERVQWLSNLNGLTQYDEIHSELSGMSKATKDEIGTLLEYRGEYNAVAEDLASITAAGSIEAIKASGRELQADIKNLDVEIADTRQEHNALQLRLDTITKLVNTVALAGQHDLDGAERDLAVQGVLVRNFEDAASAVVQERDRLHRHAANVARLTALRAQLADVNIPDDLPATQERHTYLVSEVLPGLQREIALSQEREEDLLAEKAHLEQDLLDFGNLLGFKIAAEPLAGARKATQGNIDELTAKLRDDQRSKQKVVSALSLKSGCECPTCMQEVHNGAVLQEYNQRLVASITATQGQLQDLQDRLRDIDQAAVALRNYTALPQRIENASKAALAARELPAFQEEARAHAQTLRVATENSRLIAERTMLEKAVAELADEDVGARLVELNAAIATHEATRDRYYAAQGTYDSVFTVAQDLEVTNPFDVDFSAELTDGEHELDRLSGWLEDAQLRQRQNIQRLEQMRVTVRTYAEKSTHLADLQAKVDRLAQLEDDLEIIASCMKAYGKTGMKVERLRTVMERISECLPRWTRVLFTEPYFKVKVAQDKAGTKLSLLVTKQFTTPGGKTIVNWVDASALSGGEESRFAVCIMLTLSELVAPEKRTNLLVLDETDRSCDAYGQQLIANLLIPLMRKSRPSMFVITHQLQLNPAHVDAEMVVTKQPTGLTEVKFEKPRRR